MKKFSKGLFPMPCAEIIFPGKKQLNAKYVILLILFLLFASGCSYYRIISRTPDKETNALNEVLNKKYPKNIYSREFYPFGILAMKLFLEYPVYVIDSAGRWLIEDTSFSGDTIYGRAILSPMPSDTVMPAEYRKSKRYSPKDREYFTRRVNLYTDKLFTDEKGQVSIPVSAIYKYDIYKKNSAKPFAIGMGVITGIGIALLIAVIATFFY